MADKQGAPPLAEDLWWVGVVLAVFGAVFGSLGDNLIKLSFSKEELRVEKGAKATPLACRPLWWAGMACITLLNSACTLGAYTFADASLTIPFAGLHICFNVGFARLLNSERFSSKQVGFTFIIAVGVTIVVVSGNHTTASQTAADMEQLFSHTGSIIMTLCVAMLILLELPVALLHYDARVRCFASSALVGTVAAFTQVGAKIVSELLLQASNGDLEAVFFNWVFYVGLLTLITAASAQLYLLNRTLAAFNAFVVVPVYNSFLIVLGSLYAAVMFEEYKGWSVLSETLVPLGVVTTAVGVGLLAYDHNPEASQELVLGSPVDPGDVALMPRAHSFPHSPILDEELGTAAGDGRQRHSMSHSIMYRGSYQADLHASGAQHPAELQPIAGRRRVGPSGPTLDSEDDAGELDEEEEDEDEVAEESTLTLH